MAYNEELTERVRRLLAHLPNVQEKKMFGSIGFMVNGKLCLGVGDHADHNMMVRVGPDQYEEALRRPGATPAIMRGREHPGYVFLVRSAVATQQDLEYWVGLALEYNKNLHTKE
ncbi:MAG TPA: TfoX/Sxy family protein [Candidatus Saccharimonadales bacterium]|nr:TfoX/Sxy family protein [Candidatus Saccharimonadales bacterium]